MRPFRPTATSLSRPLMTANVDALHLLVHDRLLLWVELPRSQSIPRKTGICANRTKLVGSSMPPRCRLRPNRDPAHCSGIPALRRPSYDRSLISTNLGSLPCLE